MTDVVDFCKKKKQREVLQMKNKLYEHPNAPGVYCTLDEIWSDLDSEARDREFPPLELV